MRRAVVQIVWFSLYSDHHRSAASLSNSLKGLCFVPNCCFAVEISPLLQFLHPQVQVQSHSLSSFSIPSFILTSFAWICIFLSSSQGLLATLSWCSVRFSSSEDVCLMHPGERSTPGPSTPLPSCCHTGILFIMLNHMIAP